MALKSFAKLIPAYLAALVLVFSLRWAGIVICVLLFSLLVTNTRFFHDFRVPSYSFWVYGQLIVPYVALLAFLPFGSMLLNSGISADLAAMPWIKLPADNVVLALANHPDADPGDVARGVRGQVLSQVVHPILPKHSCFNSCRSRVVFDRAGQHLCDERIAGNSKGAGARIKRSAAQAYSVGLLPRDVFVILTVFALMHSMEGSRSWRQFPRAGEF